MMQHLRGWFLSLVALKLLALNVIECKDDDNHHDDEQHMNPTFPYLFDYTKIKQLQLRVLSESVSEEGGYHTQEEYIDLKEAKSSVVTLNRDGHQVRFLDGKRGLSYEYKPYTCSVKAISSISQMSSVQEWNYKYISKVQFATRNITLDESDSVSADDTINYDDNQETREVEMRLFGVAGLWMFAERQIKTFAKSKFVYSSAKDVYRESLSWTAIDKVNDISIVFYFVDHGPNSLVGLSPELSLELIEIWSLSKKDSLLRTINVLALEYSIDYEIHEQFLEVPVGYGCYELDSDTIATNSEDRDNVDEEEDSAKSSTWDQILYRSPAIFDLEITATRFTGPPNELNNRHSDTISVQMAYSLIRNKPINFLRIRNTDSDVKIIYNHVFNVKYTIDLRRGTCSLKHLPTDESISGKVEFANNLSLELLGESHPVLFDRSTNRFKFVKMSQRTSTQPELHYFETSDSYIWQFERPTRIIKTYERRGTLNLVAITIWNLDEKRQSIVESYHINMIDLRTLSGWPDEPKAFDISEECFLNDASKRSGRDYAWIELTYPEPANVLKVIASNENDFKQLVYKKFLDGSGKHHLDFFRVPRIEFQFEDEALILRLLLLDGPPLELFLDKIDGKQLDPKSTPNFSENFAPDVAHCAQLCRLNYCTRMSFCQADFKCSISTNGQSGDPAIKLENELQTIAASGCSAYMWPRSSIDATNNSDKNLGKSINFEELSLFHEHSLHAILARLQQQDYSLLLMPEVPAELSVPGWNLDPDSDNYWKVLEEFDRKWRNCLLENDRVPELSFWSRVEGLVIALIPSKFELENDPLLGFGLDDEDTNLAEDDLGNFQSVSAAFHKGLVGSRYKNELQLTASSSLKEQANLHQFQGLTYDQCALACLDGRCGSFSYCQHRHECILSSVSSLAEAISLQITETDPECAIAVRDFLGNYVKFSNSMRPQTYVKTTEAVDPSDCSLICESETSFRCKAFDFCVSSKPSVAGKPSASCLYQTSRLSSGQVPTVSQPNGPRATGCDHYSRSSLADFNRIEYRKLTQVRLATLKTTTFEGQLADRCAHICAGELADCAAFQFCFDSAAEGAKQRCVMIQSEPSVTSSDKELIDVDMKRDGGTSKDLEFSLNCQLFSRRRDSETHLGQLANGTGPQEEAKSSAGGHWRMALVCLAITLGSALVGSGLFLVGENNELVRKKLEQIRSFLRI